MSSSSIVPLELEFPVEKVSNGIVPSSYQQAIYNFVQNGTGSAYVDAKAGSGKTTTIVHAASLLPSNEKTLFLAFNKKIATELKTRLPSYIESATFHALGFKAWRAFRSSTNVDADKMKKLSYELRKHPKFKFFVTESCNIVSKMKAVGYGVLTEDSYDIIDQIVDYFDIDLPDDEKSIDTCYEGALWLLNESVNAALKDYSSIDFDDMIYMPLYSDLAFPKYDNIFCDETQDVNGIQILMLKKALKDGGRLFAVGDVRQSIYGFRGADSDAIQKIKEEFNCKEFPLNYCYRCGKNIIKVAQTIVSDIEAPDNAIDGEVLRGVDIKKATFSNKDVILCRNTRPLIDFAYYLIGKGIGCYVLGRDFGKALNDLIMKMKAADFDDLYVKLETYERKMVIRYMAKLKEDQAAALKDRVQCIYAIMGNIPDANRSISGLMQSINTMFSDENGDLLTLSTVHRSKGLEWDRVAIYQDELMPSKFARQEWQKKQEQNLRYVAYTRAKKSLVFLQGEVNKF